MSRAWRKPRYDLVEAQKVEPLIGNSCARKALIMLGLTDVKAARRHVQKLFKGLVPGDFAHTETMRGSDGRSLFGDVYGKRDKHGVWFIKLMVEGSTTTVIMSCHEAEHPIELACGTVLKGKPS